VTAERPVGRADRRRPSLPTLIARAVADDAVFARGDLVLCAVSGGPDSMALLHALAHLRGRLGHRVAACGINHGLRTEAALELGRAAALASELEVPFESVTVDVPPGGNLQARARAARQAALRDVAARIGAVVIATGHTANDRAETLISRLLRAAGPRGLAVLPPRDGVLCRPLIRALRSDVEAYVARHAIPCSLDPSNLDVRFQRVRIRTEVLPLLESLSPRIVLSLCDLADALAPLRAAPDALAGFNAAQRKTMARALAQGRPATLLLAGGREVLATPIVAMDGDPADAEAQSADRTTGGSSVSRQPEPHVFSQTPAFPRETSVLIKINGLAAPPRRRRQT